MSEKEIACPRCGQDMNIPARYNAENIAQLEEENAALRDVGKGMLTLVDSYRENGLPIVFPYADEIVAMKEALLTKENNDED